MSKTLVVQTQVEERLNPAVLEVDTASPSIAWPFLPKTKGNAKMPVFPSAQLLRSTSFDRLRQFPAYLCSRGSSDLLVWLYASRTALSLAVAISAKQLRSLLFVASIYVVLCLLILQLFAVIYTLFTFSLPSGLLFLVACISALGYLASKVISFDINATFKSQRKSRTHKQD